MYSCNSCSNAYQSFKALRQHAIQKHPESIPVQEKKFKCSECHKQYNNKQSFSLHERKEHNIEYVKSNRLLTCAMCDFKHYDKSITLAHLSDVHNLNVVPEIKHFQCEEDFLEWKNTEEKKVQDCKFISTGGKHKIRNLRSQTLVCHRIPKKCSERTSKMRGSFKLDAFCPAEIKYSEQNGIYKVKFIKTHAHEIGLEHFRLTSEEKSDIAKEIAIGIPLTDILDQGAPTGQKNHPDYVHSINMDYKICRSDDMIRRNNQHNTRRSHRNDTDNKRTSGTPKAKNVHQKGNDISSISPNVADKKCFQDSTRTSDILKERNVFQRRTDISNMCRVCLTQSPNGMFGLAQVIQNISDICKEIPIIQALQIVTSTTIILHPKFPQYICPICLSILKMTYKFIVQFKESQMELERKLKMGGGIDDEMTVGMDVEETDNWKSNKIELMVDEDSVDLSCGYIEEGEESGAKFEGLLSKLGKGITAACADAKYEEPKLQKLGRNVYEDEEDEECEAKFDEFLSKSGNDIAATMSIADNKTLMKKKNSILSVKELQMDDKSSDEIHHGVNETASSPQVVPGKFQTDDDVASSIVEPESSHDHTYSETNGNRVTKRSRPISKLNQRTRKKTTSCHRKQVYYSKERIFECHYCTAQFMKQSDYTSHTNKHLREAFSRKLCGRSHHTKQHLNEHNMSIHSERKKILCYLCGKRFFHQNVFLRHMLLHKDEKKFQCAYCGKLFRISSALQRHERIHTDEKLFQCRFCDRQFTSKNETATHERIHTGFNPYLCKFCRVGFTKVDDLKLHLFQHSGSHKCDICDKNFIEKSILQLHHKISHENLDPDGDLSDGNFHITLENRCD